MAANLTPPLPMNMNASNLFAEYKQWMESYAIFEIASGISKKSDEIKRATLLHCLGPNVQRIFFNLPDEKENYEQTKMALDKYFTPHKNVVTERFKFRQRVQKDDESIDNYLISLRELSKSCEFGNLEADMIRDQIIENATTKTLKKNCASKPKCYRCGLDTHSAQECGAKKMTCSYCNKLGHLFRACRNRPNQNNNRNPKSFNQTKVKTIQEENKTEVGESSDEYTYYTGAENKEKVQIDEHEHLFHGLGTIKGYSHKVTLKDNYRPIAQRCRRIPYAMVEAVNQELDKMLENGIIEKVHQGSEWVSNIIVVPKRDSEEIRLCIDLREVNKAILRERHPIPTIDNMLHALKGAKVFAKLDAKKGFWQVDLDPQSRPLTTFITHRGCYRFCKVPFGLSSAPEAYQKGMDSILLDLKGVICYLDDVVVYAKDRQELEERLRKVLQRFDKVGIRLNRNKCKFAMEELDISVHIVSSEGIKPDNRKIETVLNFPIPKNIEMLRSFLGTCGFLRNFIPNFSKLAEPLNNLTRKNFRWNWDLKTNKAFQDLKESLTKEPCLAYYNLNSPTELITDASPIGLGAVLIQTQQNGIKRPIAYASRSLTDTEKRYSQIEKETLGCVWAIEHFNTYIWGRKFVLKTDHKPLIYMLNPKNGAVLPPRIQRLSWRLQPYDFEIEFIQGKQNIADIFSRQPLSNTRSRILLPSKLIKRVLRIAHETHQGMTRTKQLLREKYFWINMDFDIENLIRKCPICVRNQPLINDQPLQIVPLPSKPWMKLGIDIVGPIGHHYVLTVIDYFSSYPEAMIIEDISSKTIIKKLMEIFARHGYPHEVVADNGLQFVSTSMERFLKECGIRHIKASPYYPKSNGNKERFHRFLKKQFNSSSEEGKDWKEDLSRILMSYRTTPNRSTGKTPAFLLFSREIKTKLSSLVNDAEEDESNIKEFNMVYKEKIKTYNDIIRKASPHNFEIGNLVYVANPNNGKPDSNFRSEHHVILENTSINSFKLFNTKNGKIIHRNAKHLKHVPTQETNQGISDLIPEESQENLCSDSTRIEHLNSSDVQIPDDNSLNQDKDTSLNRPSSSRTGSTFNPVVSDRLDAEAHHQLPPEAKMDCNFSPTTKIEPLTGTNYPIWALKVGALLRGKKLFKCVILDPEPDIKDEVAWQIWSEKNDEAFGIIVTTLSDEQAGMFLDETKAKKSFREEENRMNSKMNGSHSDENEQAYRSKDRRNHYQQNRQKECFVCHKKGHLAKDCWFKNKRTQEQHGKRNANSNTNYNKQNFRNNANTVSSKPAEQTFNTSTDRVFENSSNNYSQIQTWCLDSGCTTHLSPHLDWMENVMPYESEINLAEEGKVTHATAKGDIKVSTCTENGIENVQIKGVLHVPNLRSNLLSIYELTNKGNTVIFNRDGAKIYNEQDDLIAEAQIQDRMYVMETRSRDEYSEKTENVMTTKDDCSNDNISLWHRRLNHLNEAYMKEIIQRNVVLGVNVKFKNLPECEACIMGKLTRQPYHSVTTNCTTKPLELVHMDLCGPMPYQSLGGSKYFFVLVDDFSRRTFIYFLKNKDETLGKFEEFKARVENELNLKIKDVRTDNGTEFTNHRFKNLLIKNGIHHQLSTTYSPQSNGVAERVNRTLIETARTLLFDSGLPMAFWAEAVATAPYVKNCTPHRSIKLDTPMEKWKGRKPSIRHFRIFGCLAFWPITQQHRSKFMPKSRKGIFVSYSLKRKAYRVYDIITKKIEEVRSVKFVENEKGIDYAKNIQEDTNYDHFAYKKEEENDNEIDLRTRPETSELNEETIPRLDEPNEERIVRIWASLGSARERFRARGGAGVLHEDGGV
ncbi:K02A2.6-like, partial [Cordylochernes scorpioides]